MKRFNLFKAKKIPDWIGMILMIPVFFGFLTCILYAIALFFEDIHSRSGIADIHWHFVLKKIAVGIIWGVLFVITQLVSKGYGMRAEPPKNTFDMIYFYARAFSYLGVGIGGVAFLAGLAGLMNISSFIIIYVVLLRPCYSSIKEGLKSPEHKKEEERINYRSASNNNY